MCTGFLVLRRARFGAGAHSGAKHGLHQFAQVFWVVGRASWCKQRCKHGLHQFAPVLGCYGVPVSEPVQTAVQTRFAPPCTSLHLVALVQTGGHHIPLFAPVFALLFAPDFLLCY